MYRSSWLGPAAVGLAVFSFQLASVKAEGVTLLEDHRRVSHRIALTDAGGTSETDGTTPASLGEVFDVVRDQTNFLSPEAVLNGDLGVFQNSSIDLPMEGSTFAMAGMLLAQTHVGLDDAFGSEGHAEVSAASIYEVVLELDRPMAYLFTASWEREVGGASSQSAVGFEGIEEIVEAMPGVAGPGNGSVSVRGLLAPGRYHLAAGAFADLDMPFSGGLTEGSAQTEMDFAFRGELIPAPMALGPGLALLGVVGLRRRRF